MNTSADLFDELADEFVERYRQGDRPTPQQYAERHPTLADEILDLFPTLVAMELAAHNDEVSAASAPRTLGSTPPDQLGDFRIIREIGRGGMGVVYEAEQQSLGRHVALKVLTGSAVASQTQQRRFQREARAAARMHHTNIVPVFGVGEADGHHFYIMQYIPGLALDDVLSEVRRQQNGKPIVGAISDKPDISASATVVNSMFTGNYYVPDLSVDSDDNVGDGADAGHEEFQASAPQNPVQKNDSAVSNDSQSSGVNLPSGGPNASSVHAENPYWHSVARIGIQVADALTYAHSQGIVHRDIKPANLLLDMAGTVWVTDFGLASLEDHQNLTRTGDIIGTLRYMPPESFSGQTDERGDLFSLGLTIYELLALKPAIRSTDRNQTLKLAMEAQHDKLGQVNPKIPRDLQTIVHKAIHREPDLRYQSAIELSEDLNRFLRDEPIQARRASSTERLVRWTRRNPAIASLTATCAALLLSTAAVFWYAWMTTSTALTEVESKAEQLAAETQRAIDSENAEKKQTRRALHSEAIANQAREKAQQLAKNESAALEKAEANLYIGQISLADREYQANNISAARELLDACPFPLRGWEWHYLHRLVEDGLKDDGNIKELASRCKLSVNSDGSRIAVFGTCPESGGNVTGQSHSALRVLDGQTLEAVTAIEGLQREKPLAEFFPDGERLLVVHGETRKSKPKTVLVRRETWASRFATSVSRTLRGWQPFGAKSAVVRILSTDVGAAAESIGDSIAITPVEVFKGRPTQDFCWMSIHDAASGEQVIAFPELPGRVIAIAVNPDGKKVASIMQFYDAETSRTVRQISIHDAISGNRQLVRDLPGGGSAGHLEFSPNGKLLIAVKGQLREPIDVLDAQTCRPL